MVETVTFTPAELFAGKVSEIRKQGTVKSGQNLAANTVVMSDAAGKWVIHDGVTTKNVAGVLIYAVDASAADAAGAVYKDGDFIATKLVWPATIDGGAVSDLLKAKLLENSNIFVSFYNAGEL
jgi:hypothetical protein